MKLLHLIDSLNLIFKDLENKEKYLMLFMKNSKKSYKIKENQWRTLLRKQIMLINKATEQITMLSN
jgi:hypothetical protein